MPRGDGTGPMGQGPMTGRAAGYCAGYPTPGYMNPVVGGYGWGRGGGRGRGRGGRGFGWGRGQGWGWQNPYAAPYAVPYAAPYYEPTANQERDMLKEQSELLRQELQDIQDRIKTLEKAEKK